MKPLPEKKGSHLQSKFKKPFQFIGTTIFGLLIILLLVLFFFLIQSKMTGAPPSIGNYHIYFVRSGSMSPTFKMGSMILVKKIPPDSIKKGEIITFLTSEKGETVTHRVMDKVKTKELQFITKGDANNVEDPDTVLAQNVIGKVTLWVPYIGYIIGFSQSRLGLVVLILFPAFIIMLIEMMNILKLLSQAEEHKLTGEKDKNSLL